MSVMVGFYKNGNNIKEALPYSEQLSSEIERRILFFNLYNYYVDKEMRITKKEILNGKTIYEVFKNKSVSISDNLLLKRRFSNLIEFQKGHLLFNLEDMFLHLVYERIKLVNKDSKVYLYEKTIIINPYDKEVSPTLVIPSYTKVSGESIYQESIISHHLETVLKTLNETQIRQIYLVYPKNLKFKKHITIKLMDKIELAEDEYRVKMIPYSFSFCTRAVKRSCSCTSKQLKGKICQ